MYLYVRENTILHNLNPITKIIGLILLFAIPLYFTHPLQLAAALCLVLVLTLWARAIPNLRRMWLFFVMLGLFSALLWSVFHKEGEAILSWGPLSVSRESILYGLGMAMRLNTTLISGLVFLSCTRIEEFTMGLNKMGLPFSMSFALSLSFRLVPLFFSTASTIAQAQKARGLDMESGGIIRRIRKYIPLLIPVFIYGIRNVDLLAMAVESKGFGATRERSYYLEFRMQFKDYAALGVLVLMNLLCIYIVLNRQ